MRWGSGSGLVWAAGLGVLLPQGSPSLSLARPSWYRGIQYAILGEGTRVGGIVGCDTLSIITGRSCGIRCSGGWDDRDWDALEGDGLGSTVPGSSSFFLVTIPLRGS